MPDQRSYWGTGAQLKAEELLPAATAEQRYVLPVQVAFHVASEPLATTFGQHVLLRHAPRMSGADRAQLVLRHRRAQ